MFLPIPSRREPPASGGVDVRVAGALSAEHSGGTLRRFTGGVVYLSVAATGLLMLEWVPAAAAATPGGNFHCMRIVPLMALCLVVGTVPGLVVGFAQLWWRPRLYGLVSLAAGCLPYFAFQLTSWLLLDLRGIGDD
jgi:hypothetical protein